MRPIFNLYGHIALKFNIKPVCDVFLKTQDLKSLPISNGNIGKTKRHLATRIKEHRSEKSPIGQHLQTCHTCDHNFNENQFKVFSTCNSDFDCKIREALLIKSEKPTLNQQFFQNGSTFILCVFK